MEAKLSKQEIETLSRTPEKRKWYSKIGLALFIMTIPTVIYIFIFHYLPLSGLIIAFKDYSSFKSYYLPLIICIGFLIILFVVMFFVSKNRLKNINS